MVEPPLNCFQNYLFYKGMHVLNIYILEEMKFNFLFASLAGFAFANEGHQDRPIGGFNQGTTNHNNADQGQIHDQLPVSHRGSRIVQNYQPSKSNDRQQHQFDQRPLHQSNGGPRPFQQNYPNYSPPPPQQPYYGQVIYNQPYPSPTTAYYPISVVLGTSGPVFVTSTPTISQQQNKKPESEAKKQNEDDGFNSDDGIYYKNQEQNEEGQEKGQDKEKNSKDDGKQDQKDKQQDSDKKDYNSDIAHQPNQIVVIETPPIESVPAYSPSNQVFYTNTNSYQVYPSVDRGQDNNLRRDVNDNRDKEGQEKGRQNGYKGKNNINQSRPENRDQNHNKH